MEDKISKQIAKDIASLIIAGSISYIDRECFAESEDLLTYEEQEMVIKEMQKISNSIKNRLSKKGIDTNKGATRDIILEIVYE